MVQRFEPDRQPGAARSSPELSPLEFEIMNVVWELGDCSSAEVIKAFRKVRPLADTTIRTVLSNIRRKGYLELVPTVDRALRFRPTIPRSEVARRSLQSFVARHFRGSTREAICFLLEQQCMGEADIREIARIVERHRHRRSPS